MLLRFQLFVVRLLGKMFRRYENADLDLLIAAIVKKGQS